MKKVEWWSLFVLLVEESADNRSDKLKCFFCRRMAAGVEKWTISNGPIRGPKQAAIQGHDVDNISL